MNDFLKKLAYWDASAVAQVKIASDMNKKVKEVQKGLNFLYRQNPLPETGIMDNLTMKKLNQFIADKGFTFSKYENNYYDRNLLNEVIQVAKDSMHSLMQSKINSLPAAPEEDKEVSDGSEEQISYERPTSSTL